MISNLIPSVISSPELVSGHKHCVMQDGRIISQSGQEAALANLSARQAKVKDLLMSDTCGPRSFTSSSSANLTLFLVSRLQAKTASAGSTLYKLYLEAENYTTAALDLCAAGFGAPHIRQRLYWVADTHCARLEG